MARSASRSGCGEAACRLCGFARLAQPPIYLVKRTEVRVDFAHQRSQMAVTGVKDLAELTGAEAEIGGDVGHRSAGGGVAVDRFQCASLLRREHEQHSCRGRPPLLITSA